MSFCTERLLRQFSTSSAYLPATPIFLCLSIFIAFSLPFSLCVCPLPQRCESRLSHPLTRVFFSPTHSLVIFPCCVFRPLLYNFHVTMWLSACIRMSGTGLSVMGLIHSVRPLVEAEVFVCAICVLRSVPRVDVKGLSKTSLGTATACCQADWSLWQDVQSRRRGLYIWGEVQYIGNKAIHVSSRGSGFECTVITEHEWVSSVRLFRACDASTIIKAFLNVSELKLKIHAKFTLIPTTDRYKESKRLCWVHHRSLKLRSSVDN